MNEQLLAIIIIVTAAITFILGFVLFLHSLYVMIFRRRHRRSPYDGLDGPAFDGHREMARSLIDRLLSAEREEIYITSYDGLCLKAVYYHTKDGAPLQIMCHGYRSTAVRDMCGGGNEALKMGHNLLLISHRAHDDSEGKTITFGYKESRDLMSWVDYAEERFGDIPIILVGLSMGGATVLMTSSAPLPKNVICIVSDCPFSSAKEIIKKELRERHLSAAVVYPFIRLAAIIFGRFDPNKASAIDAVREARLPILFIHGEEDRFVPTEMSRELYAACSSERELLIVPSARHGMSYITDTETYVAVCRAFIERHLTNYYNPPTQAEED